MTNFRYRAVFVVSQGFDQYCDAAGAIAFIIQLFQIITFGSACSSRNGAINCVRFGVGTLSFTGAGLGGFSWSLPNMAKSEDPIVRSLLDKPLFGDPSRRDSAFFVFGNAITSLIDSSPARRAMTLSSPKANPP